MPFQESKKNGYFRGLQRYKCLDCNHIFNNKRRDHKTNTSKKIWQDYIDHKQTVQELCQQHSVSHPTIEKYLDNYQLTNDIVYPSQAEGLADLANINCVSIVDLGFDNNEINYCFDIITTEPQEFTNTVEPLTPNHSFLGWENNSLGIDINLDYN